MMFLDEDDGVVEELAAVEDASSCILAGLASSGLYFFNLLLLGFREGGLELEHFVTLYLRDDSSRRRRAR